MKTHYYNDLIVELCDNNHLTVDEIYSEILKKDSKVGKSSVYRNVEFLVEEELLNKVVGIGKKSYFEKAKEPHLHLIDTETGDIKDIDISLLSLSDLPESFKVSNIDLKIYGSFS